MRINEKLKRCPFCGGDVEIRACDDEEMSMTTNMSLGSGRGRASRYSTSATNVR